MRKKRKQSDAVPIGEEGISAISERRWVWALIFYSTCCLGAGAPHILGETYKSEDDRNIKGEKRSANRNQGKRREQKTVRLVPEQKIDNRWRCDNAVRAQGTK